MCYNAAHPRNVTCILPFFPAKFSVYDGMIFPERQQPASFMQRMGGVLMNIFSTQEPVNRELLIPNHEIVQQRCLHYFLEKHRILLQNIIFTKKNLKVTYISFVKDIYSIYQQLRHQKVCSRYERTPRIARSLFKVKSVYIALNIYCSIVVLAPPVDPEF